MFRHRGFTHTIIALITFTLLLGLLNFEWAMAMAIGYISHLILDEIYSLKGKRRTT